MRIQIGQRPANDFSNPLGLLSDCHRRIEHFLQVLLAIAAQATDGTLPRQYSRELEAALTYFSVAAPHHTADEESSVFPRLRATDDVAAARVLETLDRLERDHEEADQLHRQVDGLGRRWLSDGRLGEDDVAALRTHLQRLDAIYREHIGIEDRELFPVAARLLSSSELHDVGREMAERRSLRVPSTT
ncbi:MAG: hemerythrin domain-containing protein [Acidobacteria bacterium]|nr:hemerythrin domain-containing protein [Acidobacteriota bacterium]